MTNRAQLAIGLMTVGMLVFFAIASAASDRMPIAGVLAGMALLRGWVLARQWRSASSGQPQRRSNR
jgi:hypothetical protein